MSLTTKLILVSIITFLVNLPFGYWRANVKKFGLQWFLAVHLPVPLIIILRIFGGIGFHWTTYVFLVTAYFSGQFLGSRIHFLRLRKNKQPLSSCLIMDIFRCLT